MHKILTVVIPTYNMEHLLPRCLDSLVSPNCPPELEILVVNDGSKDNSLQLARQYESLYPNIIKVIDKENGNYGSAINKGIELAKGKYFRILDADDYYDNDGLNILVKSLKNIDSDIILTNYRRDRGNEKKLYKTPSSKCNIERNFSDINILEYPNFVMHGITLKTSILKDNNINLQHGISYTDIEFCFYPLPFLKSFIALDILVYCYQLGREGQTVDVNSQIKSVENMSKIATRMHNTLLNNNYNDNTFVKLRKFYCDINGLAIMTILCLDTSNSNLNIVDNLVKQLSDIKGCHNLMMSRKFYGIKFYKRFVYYRKLSNGRWFSLYYQSIKRLLPIYSIIKKVFRH